MGLLGIFSAGVHQPFLQNIEQCQTTTPLLQEKKILTAGTPHLAIVKHHNRVNSCSNHNLLLV